MSEEPVAQSAVEGLRCVVGLTGQLSLWYEGNGLKWRGTDARGGRSRADSRPGRSPDEAGRDDRPGTDPATALTPTATAGSLDARESVSYS